LSIIYQYNGTNSTKTLKTSIIVRYVPIYRHIYNKILKKWHDCDVCTNIMVHGIWIGA